MSQGFDAKGFKGKGSEMGKGGEMSMGTDAKGPPPAPPPPAPSFDAKGFEGKGSEMGKGGEMSKGADAKGFSGNGGKMGQGFDAKGFDGKGSEMGKEMDPSSQGKGESFSHGVGATCPQAITVKFTGLPEDLAFFTDVAFQPGAQINGKSSYSVVFQAPPGEPQQHYTLWHATANTDQQQKMWVVSMGATAGQSLDCFFYAEGDVADPTQVTSQWFSIVSQQFIPQPALKCTRA